MDSPDANKAKSSRRLLFWIVMGVIVLNILLFLKFGLRKNSGEAPAKPISGTNKSYE
jgi:hypothetical protein